MKVLIFLLLFCGSSAGASAAIDLAKLRPTVLPPTVSEVYHKYLALRRTLQYSHLNSEQKEALLQLEQVFRPEELPPTLYLETTSAPNWANRVEPKILSLVTAELFSRLAENITGNPSGVSEYCQFLDPNNPGIGSDSLKKMAQLDVDSTLQIRWNAVKKVDDESLVAHVAFLVASVTGLQASSGGRTACNVPLERWAYQEAAGELLTLSTQDLQLDQMK